MKPMMASYIAEKVEEYISSRGQSKNALDQYHYILSVFIKFCQKHNDGYYSEEIGLRCLSEHYGVSGVNVTIDRSQKRKRTAVRVFHMMTSVLFKEPINDRYLPIKFSGITVSLFLSSLNDFEEHHKKYGYSEKTIENYSRVAKTFLAYAENTGYDRFELFSTQLVYDYVQTLSGFTKVTIKHHLGALRIFLRFLHTEGFIDIYLDDVVKPLKSRSQTKIPSVWQKEEVIKLLSAVDRGNPGGKRDYAMLLLVTRLGIRISDVNKLRFENINWSKKTLQFIQHKTNEPITLPLLNDVGWALIDYIKNGRPKIDSPYIFVTHIPPYKEFSIENHHYETVKKYIAWAHIPGKDMRKLGMHSLRHTLATLMLENHENYYDISAAIGHRSLDTTKVYLKTGIELLRECTLPTPEVDYDLCF